MPLKVAALYQFAALPDFRELREPLRALAAGLGIKGSVLLAHEGINGTVAGSDEAIDALVRELQHGTLFGGRLDDLELKFSSASEMPFQRLKIRLKKEIVTLGDTAVDPTRQVGTYVEPSDWNALIAAPDTLVIDTRNAFEVAMGTFEGAVENAERLLFVDLTPECDAAETDPRNFDSGSSDSASSHSSSVFVPSCHGGVRA